MTDEPTVLRSRTGADFLASLPTLAGFIADDSLMLVPVRANRTTGGVLRIDLDVFRGDDDHDASALDLVQRLRRIEGCDGVTIVIVAKESFPVARLLWQPLWSALVEALEVVGLNMIDALVRTPDGWGSFSDEELPARGRSLTDIERSPLSALAAGVRGGEPLRDIVEDRVLPRPEPAFADALRSTVELLLDLNCSIDSFGRIHDAEPFDPITTVEELLRPGDASRCTVPQMARLIALCAVPATRDQALIQIAFGEKAGRSVARENARLHHQQARTGRSMDETVRREMRAGRRPYADLDGAMIGDTTRMPHPDRMHRAIAILRRAIPAVDPQDQGGPLCLLAWLHWATGSQNAAVERIADAARVAPGLSMVPVLRQLIYERSPAWLYRRR